MTLSVSDCGRHSCSQTHYVRIVIAIGNLKMSSNQDNTLSDDLSFDQDEKFYIFTKTGMDNAINHLPSLRIEADIDEIIRGFSEDSDDGGNDGLDVKQPNQPKKNYQPVNDK